MQQIDPNGDNYLCFTFGAVPKEAQAEVYNFTYFINFYPIFHDLVKEEFEWTK